MRLVKFFLMFIGRGKRGGRASVRPAMDVDTNMEVESKGRARRGLVGVGGKMALGKM